MVWYGRGSMEDFKGPDQSTESIHPITLTSCHGDTTPRLVLQSGPSSHCCWASGALAEGRRLRIAGGAADEEDREG